MAARQVLKKLPNGNGIKGFPSVYKNMNFVTGLPDAARIEEELGSNGYCLYRETGLKNVEDLIDHKIPQAIFSSYLKEPRDVNFHDIQSNIFMTYQHGTDDRTGYGSNILDVTAGAPSTNFVSHHCELAYTDMFPRIITFICLETDEFEQGYTPISNLMQMEKELDFEMKNKLFHYGIKYTRLLPKEDAIHSKTWPKMLHVESKEEAEQTCDYWGYGYQWRDNDYLKLEYIRPAFVECCDRKEFSFGNSILGMHGSNLNNVNEWTNVPYTERPYHSTYGNGDEFSESEIKYLDNLHEKYELLFKWNVGDVLILDNLHWSHGRYPFSGKRKIVTMMGMPLVRTPMVNGPFACDYEIHLKEKMNNLKHGQKPSEYHYLQTLESQQISIGSDTTNESNTGSAAEVITNTTNTTTTTTATTTQAGIEIGEFEASESMVAQS